MDAVPWWGSGLFTLGGALLGALSTLALGVLNRRTERRRLARDKKVAAYPELVAATTRLLDLVVWPADDDPRVASAEVERLVAHIAFFAPARVNATLGPVLGATRDLSTLVVHIRAESSPGHGGRIDRRLAPRHGIAGDRLRRALTGFATAARADLEINTPYTPVTAAIPPDDHAGTMNVAREPGAGSREPGAGSREPGAGSREPGAGSREPWPGSREPGAVAREPGAGSREPGS